MLLLDADSFSGVPLVFECHVMVGRVRPDTEQLKDALENSVSASVVGVMVRLCPPVKDCSF